MGSFQEKIASAREIWRRRLEKSGKQSEEAVRRADESLYLPEEPDAEAWLEKIGFPGDFPYTRGVHPTMYTERPWTMRQYAGFGDAGETNERFRYLLEQGQTGLSVAFDLPTQMGYDSDDPMAEGEVGKTGVAIDSVDDMARLFDRIDLASVSSSMTINAPAAVLLAMYIVVAEESGVSPDRLRGTVQNDILKEYAARGTYIFPPEPSMRLTADLFRYCSEHAPSWNTISISGYHIREAGSTAVQEVAFTLANGIQYVTSAIGAGLDVDAFAGRLSFFFNSHNDLFEEAAKFRAARRMWANIMRDRFGAKSPRSWTMRFHTQTAGSMLTAAQPDNNVVRVAYQALAAVLGGTQSLHTNGRDEALSLPTQDSARIALRTQQILAHETGAANAIDPLGGSYYVEALTDKIEREALAIIEEIDRAGGALSFIREGRMQREIAKSAYEWQMAVEKKQKTIVGVNAYQMEEPPPEVFRHNPETEGKQIERVKRGRSERDSEASERACRRLTEAARSEEESLMPHILEAARARATLGEICGALQAVFGRHHEGGHSI